MKPVQEEASRVTAGPFLSVDALTRWWQSGGMAPPKVSRLSEKALTRLITAIDAALAEADNASEILRLRASLDPSIVRLLDTVFTRPLSYRDGVLIQLAWGLELPRFDHTKKGEGARSTAKQIGLELPARHIPAVKDAYQNIGKNSPLLARGNEAEFDELLGWMNRATEDERKLLLDLCVALTARTSRPVLPMPQLARAELSFAKVVGFLDVLLATPSQGAHEQFAVAAFLEALINEFGLSGVGALGVRTKNINATDASAGTAADVQIVRGNRIEEAFEVSASGWKGKVDQALASAQAADLSRIHILAHVAQTDILSEVTTGNASTDVTVIDVRSFLRTLVAVLRKPAREEALQLLYTHLDRKQPVVERVNAFVGLLSSHALTA